MYWAKSHNITWDCALFRRLEQNAQDDLNVWHKRLVRMHFIGFKCFFYFYKWSLLISCMIMCQIWIFARSHKHLSCRSKVMNMTRSARKRGKQHPVREQWCWWERSVFTIGQWGEAVLRANLLQLRPLSCVQRLWKRERGVRGGWGRGGATERRIRASSLAAVRRRQRLQHLSTDLHPFWAPHQDPVPEKQERSGCSLLFLLGWQWTHCSHAWVLGWGECGVLSSTSPWCFVFVWVSFF